MTRDAPSEGRGLINRASPPPTGWLLKVKVKIKIKIKIKSKSWASTSAVNA